MLRRSLRIFTLAAFCGLLLTDLARADFDLPILHRVPKVVSVSESIPVQKLLRFASVKDMVLEFGMENGNMLRESSLKILNEEFAGVLKRIVLTETLLPVHVEQLRRLDRFEVVYPLGPSGALAPVSESALSRLGPVRKRVVLPIDFAPEALVSLRRLKRVDLRVSVPEDGLSASQLAALESHRTGRVHFVLPAGADAGLIHPLLACAKPGLIVGSQANRVNREMIDIIKDLRGVEPVIVVDGRLTLDNVRPLVRLDRFVLRVEIGVGQEVTPGLVHLLNRVAPP